MFVKRQLRIRPVREVVFGLPAVVVAGRVELIGDFTARRGLSFHKLRGGRLESELDLDPGPERFLLPATASGGAERNGGRIIPEPGLK